jgi:hypothetical protein
MKEYKLAKGLAIFVYIFAPLMIALFAWLAIMPFTPDSKDMSPMAAWFLVPLSLVMIITMLFILLEAIKGKVIIGEGKIRKTGMMGTRELAFHQIKGFIVNQNYIVIEPAIVHKKKLKISVAYGNMQEIVHWLASNFPNADEVNREKEEQAFYDNEMYGATVDERKKRLGKATEANQYLGFAGAAAGIWAFVHPYPYILPLILCIIVPFLALIVMKYHKGLIRFDTPKGSVYANPVVAFLGPALGLAWRAVNDYHILEYRQALLLAGIIMAVLTGALLVLKSNFNLRQVHSVLFLCCLQLFTFGYGYGTVVVLNCYYTSSKPAIFITRVTDMKISKGSRTDYYLYLAPWGKQLKGIKTDIPRDLYKSLEKNDQVKILQYKGLFNIPWFSISR